MAHDLLNMLRFKEIADYSSAPELAPGAAISGADAYDRYLASVLPAVREAGGTVLYRGAGGPWLLGPADEQWDLVLIVRHVDEQAFSALLTDPGYHLGTPHRTAALVDSRAIVLRPQE
ncbi:MAG: hypothetical protein JWO22_926 [Frankiales bacterium]|nr:hypothetical protein [Frankiales bacterium]